MSSGSERDRPMGVIRQGKKVVGTICIPDGSDIFIREFNHCYGQLRMEVSESQDSRTPPANPNSFRLPTWFRHVWHQTQRLETTNPESQDPSTAP